MKHFLWFHRWSRWEIRPMTVKYYNGREVIESRVERQCRECLACGLSQHLNLSGDWEL